MNLKHLTDKTLLEDLKMLVANERVFLTKILHHLREVDERKLYSDLKYPSLFEYAVKELGYSEAAASRRIQAARLLKQLPVIEKKIESGALSLSNLAKAQRLFNQQEIKDPVEKRIILAKIENKSARECDKELLQLSPAPSLPKEGQKIITAEHTQLKVNVTEETFQLLHQAKLLLGKGKLNDDFFHTLSLKAITEIKRHKFKLNTTGKGQQSLGRYLPAASKKEVYENSNGLCENCGSLFMLQYDHIQAFALGGKSETSNLRLLCFNCNQRFRLKARL